jgi:hypothetical protein
MAGEEEVARACNVRVTSCVSAIRLASVVILKIVTDDTFCVCV